MSIAYRLLLALTIVSILVAGCGKAEPTATPLPPTNTPAPTATTASSVPTTTPIPPTATLAAATGTPLSETTSTLTPSPPPPTPQPTPTNEPTADTVAFVDSGQELGEGRSTDVALGDLDGDGDLDALVGNQGQAQVWLNDGQASFSPNGGDLTIPSGWNMGLDLGDLDEDGDLDAFIVVAEGPGRVLLNQGGAQGGTAGSFADSGQELADDSGFGFDLDLGDVDGDGDLDAYVAHERANLVWLNDGQGTFTDSGQRLGAAITAGVALADLDGDGDLDALAGGWDEPARVWLNDGQGNFSDSGHTLTAAEVHIHGLDVGDLDGDGDLDVFLAIASGHPNQVWFNDGQGTFTDSGQQLRSSLSHAVVLGDLDGDGDLDAFVANAAPSAGAPNTIWLNDGQGNFRDSGLRLGNGLSYGVDLGDLTCPGGQCQGDGDGDLDAFVANNNPPNKVWLNERYQAAPSSQAIISANTADQVVQLQTLDAHTDRVYGLAFSSDGRRLASGSWDGTIRLWDVETWQQTHTLEHDGNGGVYWAAGDTLLASGDGKIWDVASGQELHSLNKRRLFHIAFSPDGQLLASPNPDGSITLQNVSDWEVIRTFQGHTDRVFGLDFSPDGRLLASGSGLDETDTSDYTVRIWDVASGQAVHVLEGHRGDVHDVAFSPDGKYLASASTDYTVRVWDVQSGRLVHTLQHRDGLWGVAFSPDSSLLASGGVERTVRLWDVASGKKLHTLPHADEVMAVAFAPDSRLLVSGGYDNLVYVWGISP